MIHVCQRPLRHQAAIGKAGGIASAHVARLGITPRAQTGRQPHLVETSGEEGGGAQFGAARALAQAQLASGDDRDPGNGANGQSCRKIALPPAPECAHGATIGHGLRGRVRCEPVADNDADLAATIDRSRQ